jgi:hypothetical protein
MKPKSGRDLGADHAERVAAYLRSTPNLPAHNGKLNASAIAKACGFTRSVIYANPAVRKLLDEAAAKAGLGPIETAGERDSESEVARLQKRLSRVEQENAAYRAESEELRRRLRLVEHIEEHFIETGRRIIP